MLGTQGYPGKAGTPTGSTAKLAQLAQLPTCYLSRQSGWLVLEPKLLPSNLLPSVAVVCHRRGSITLVFERCQTNILPLFSPWTPFMPATPAPRPCDPNKPEEMVATLASQHHLPPFPLHHSVKHRLHPEYVAFYNKYVQYARPVYDLSVDMARISGGPPPSHTDPLAVGKIQDISILRHETPGPDIPIRCFTPPGVPPRNGWPLVHYAHGGGWVFGDVDTENTVCSHICVRSRAVVITTDYRLAIPRAPSPLPQDALHPPQRIGFEP